MSVVAYRVEEPPDGRPLPPRTGPGAAPTPRERLFRLQAEIADLESAGLAWLAAARRAERDRLAAQLAAAIRKGMDPAE
ncbi:hypothetical protein ACWDA3_42910 [Nonomuraea rubra]